MSEGNLGNQSEETRNNDLELGLGGNVEELGFQRSDETGNGMDTTVDKEGEMTAEDFTTWVNRVEAGWDAVVGSEIQRVNADDVDLNLGLGGDPSSSSSAACVTQKKRPKIEFLALDWGTDLANEVKCPAPVVGKIVNEDMLDPSVAVSDEPITSSTSSKKVAMERESCDHDDNLNKRPRYSLSLDWGSDLTTEVQCFAPANAKIVDEDVPDSSGAGIDDRNSSDGIIMDDSLEVRMDLTDDLLHMVLSFLDHQDLCSAASVCQQWRDASSHEDFWRYLNFENRRITERQFANMCRRYPNATAVNIYGTPAINPLGLKAICSLRNIEVLTLGKGQLCENFFELLTDCHTLRSLTINDATLGGVQEISIEHDKLRNLQIVKCRVLRVSIRCLQLETLSLKRSNMTYAVLQCPLLRDLDLASCHKLADAAIRVAAASCPLLESLDISCSSVSDETLREIATACGNLHVLDASYCPNIVLESVVMPMLTVLKLHSCGGITSASMTAIRQSYMLEVLELDNCSLLTSVSLNLPRLQKIRLVHCRKFTELNLRSSVLSSITVSNCPSLQRISIASDALKKLVLQKQESLTELVLECHCLEEVDLTECESLTSSVCKVFSDGGGCPVLSSLVLDSCESLTKVSFISNSLVSISFGGCRAMTSLDLNCPHLQHISLDGCDHLERAFFSPVGLRSLNLGICPKLNVLHLEAQDMMSLELKGCGVLSEALIDCPLLTSLDASFCSQLKDDCLSATSLSCPLIESLVLMSCHSVGPNGLSYLRSLRSLTNLDLSYTFLVNLQPVFDSCLYLKVLKLQACKYLSDKAFEPLYKDNALPALCELDLSYGTLSQSAIEELLACCGHLTHISLNGCANMNDLGWGFRIERLSSQEKKDGQANRLLQNLNCVGCPNIKKVVIPPSARCFHLSLLNLSLSSNLREVDISCCNLFIFNLSNCYSLEILKLDCPRLTSLFLQSCNIDGQAVAAAVGDCSMLETLDLRFCPKISPSSLTTLRTICPSLKRIFNSLVPI